MSCEAGGGGGLGWDDDAGGIGGPTADSDVVVSVRLM